MLVGMGTVFVFLTVLVFMTQMMSKIVQRFAPFELDGEPNSRLPVQGRNQADEEVAAITAAIALHRRR